MAKARTIYYLAAEGTEDAPSVVVDDLDGSYPIVENNGSAGWMVRISETLMQYIPYSRVLLVEESEV